MFRAIEPWHLVVLLVGLGAVVAVIVGAVALGIVLARRRH
jgi:hypothetical protein